MTAELGKQLGLYMVVPFVGMLLSIAILPLTAEHWFEKNRNKAIVAAVFGLPTVIYLIAQYGHLGWENALHTAEEYVSFIMLLAALYTIAGGIYLTGNLLGSPRNNVIFLLIGALLASLIGTTGAAMVLIRPLLRANSERKYTKHIVIFFIFIVCNIGGMLTPLGDPPLFLGFLRGVSFFWTFQLWPQWLLGVGLTILAFLAFEFFFYRKESPAAKRVDVADYVPIRVVGKINLLFLAGVILAVLFSDQLLSWGERIHFPFVRELIMIVMIMLSLRVAPRGPRTANHFSWHPIVEVGVLFAGIFASMIPALALLEARGGSIGLTQPWHFFWSTGLLSSFLDNAPTYLTFTSTAQGLLGIDSTGGLMSIVPAGPLGLPPSKYLAAISVAAVMMGANTYIGNAPNFMVKSISERAGVKMPSFFGYMMWSVGILFPVFGIVTVLFFL